MIRWNAVTDYRMRAWIFWFMACSVSGCSPTSPTPGTCIGLVSTQKWQLCEQMDAGPDAAANVWLRSSPAASVRASILQLADA